MFSQNLKIVPKYLPEFNFIAYVPKKKLNNPVIKNFKFMLILC
jgi:hypothetical protein